MIVNNKEKCCYCGGCVGVCPVQAITLNDPNIEINHNKCTECLSCVKLCPVAAMQQKEGEK